MHLISENVYQTTFDEIIDEMISNAWYSVREFHIHLSGIQSDGMVRDGLERAVNLLSEYSSLQIWFLIGLCQDSFQKVMSLRTGEV